MVLCIFISSFSPIHHPSAFSHSTSPASCPENRCDYKMNVAIPSISTLVVSVSFPRLVILTLTVPIHAASSMQVVRLMDFL